MVGGRDALDWFLGYRRGAEGNGVVVYREVIDLQGQTFNIGEVVFEFEMSNASRALIWLLQLEDSVPPNNIRIFCEHKAETSGFYEDMVYPHKAFALGKWQKSGVKPLSK